MNLSVREAAAKSRTIAEVLKDDRYTTSPSSLSDYELRNTPPRDFHKVITLCSIYGLQFESVMKRMGIDVADAGTESMPDRYLFRAEPTVAAKRGDAGIVGAGFLEKLLEECQEIPLFLRDSLGYFSGSAHVSLDDFFWVGGDDDPLHPYLANGLLAIVNRRRKTAFHFASKPVWQQPIYMVLKRDGTYLAACCAGRKRQTRCSSVRAGFPSHRRVPTSSVMRKSSDKLSRSCGDFHKFAVERFMSVFRTHCVLHQPLISMISLRNLPGIDRNPNKALIFWTNHIRVPRLGMIADLAGIREAARCPPSLSSEGRTGCRLNSSG